MRRHFLPRAMLAAILGCSVASAARGEPVNTIQFPDGNVLDIVGSVGTGSNTAYLALDFSNNAPPGPQYAWQYNWTGSATELNMLQAVAAAPGNNLTIVPDPTYGYDFIDDFDYGTNIGSAVPFPVTGAYSYWASYIGQYDSTDSNNAATQNVNWVFAPSGADLLTLGDLYDDSGDLLSSGVEGLLYGWTVTTEADDFVTGDPTPLLPETAVPEPATIGLLIVAGIGLLGRRRAIR